MKTSKNQIEKSTRSRKITRSNECNYTYQISMDGDYTKDSDFNVIYTIGNKSVRIGYASTKKKFIELVYNHINNI